MVSKINLITKIIFDWPVNPVIRILQLQTNVKEFISKYIYANKNCEINAPFQSIKNTYKSFCI